LARRSLILDSGAVIALTRGDRAVRGIVHAAVASGARIIVPPAVITQTARGAPADAPLHRLLQSVWTPFVGKRLALAAGSLLGRSGLADASDAQVMAEAIRSGPSVLITGDVADMSRLSPSNDVVRVVGI
jgi:hypothetical protein